ncbi:MAG TPA: hypothetical protein DHU96_08605 [Actinobacteria bacterium]|nr:hypothetical protein [Actinomycetota bacterium]
MLGCGKVLATVPAGESAGLVVNQATGTLYGMRPGVGAVTVINRDTCDAVTTTGCASPATAIRGGPIPVGGAADPAANTVYFAGRGSSVFMVDASACRAGNLNRCQVELSDGANGNSEMIAAGAHGIAYGWAQHPQNVRFALTSTSPGRLPAPSSVHLNGLTFFITRLPESACAYHSTTLHAVATKGPAWGGVENRINGACIPNRLVPMGNGGGAAAWGRGVNAWATP